MSHLFNKQNYFFTLYIITLAAPFIIRDAAYHVIMYAGLIPATIVYSIQTKEKWKKWKKPYTLWALGALLGYTFLHALILSDPASSQYARRTLLLVFFVWGTILFFQGKKEHQEKLYKTLILTATISATIFAVYFLYQITFTDAFIRMKHIVGQYTHPIGGGFAFGCIGLLSLIHWAKSKTKKEQIGYFVATCILAFYLLAMQSKGPLLAFTLIGFLILALYKKWKLFTLGSIIVCAAIISIINLYTPLIPALREWMMSFEIIQYFVERGGSYRTELWGYTLEQTKNVFWFGNGLEAQFQYIATHAHHHPHNLYISAIYYTGWIGLGLLLNTLLPLLKTAVIKIKETAPISLLVLFALISSLFDGAQYIPGLSAWLLFLWFPISALISKQIK